MTDHMYKAPQPVSVEMVPTQISPALSCNEGPSLNQGMLDEKLEGKIDFVWDAISRQPKKAYCITCGSFCGFFFLFIVILMVAGSSFFPFSSDVPIYLRGHVTKQRSDAIVEGKDIADYTLNAPDIELRQSVDTLGGEREDLTLEIIYFPEFGDVLETKILQKMFEFEQRVMARNEFADHCLIDYNSTEVAFEQSNNVDMITKINSQSHNCAVHHTIVWACDPSLGTPCSKLASTPIGLMNCNKSTTCTPDEFILEENFKVPKVHTYANSIPDRNTVEGLNSNNFLKLVDSQFGAGNQIAKAVKTEFTFGAPLKGYKTVNDDPDGQSEDLAQWLYDEYHTWLGDGQISGGGVSYIYNGHGMLGLYIQEVMVTDGMFAIASMVFVLVYIAFMTSSWWLAVMGMGQILMCFPVAYFLYFGIFQQRYFGVFNMLSIFIILGIGADDIFVFLDTWEQSGHKFKSLGKRMSYTWKHAGKAMLVTSLSTMISFMSNANSSFPAIQTFGIFAAMLVLVNYCAVMVFYPTVVFMFATFFEEWKFCCGWPSKFATLVKQELRPVTFKNVKIVMDEEGREQFEEEVRSEPAVSQWFRESYSSGIIGAKIGIILIFIVVIVVFGIQASKVEADPKNAQFMPSSNNYQKFLDENPKHFARGGSVNAVKMIFAWGIDKENPIDRSGTLATDVDDPGKPVWDPNFDLPVAARCMLSICEKAQEKSDERKTGGYPDFPIDCFLIDFKKHVDANDTALWNKITGPGAKGGQFFDMLVLWLEDPKVLSMWKPYIHAELVDGTPQVRFISTELKLTVESSNIDPDDGKALWNTWEDWFNDQYNSEPCKSVAAQAGGFQSSLDFIYVRAKLVEEALSGIYFSIGLAFAVLTLATTNILVAFFAVLVISCVVVCTMGMTVVLGWKLGILESVGLVMVPGLSVDFVAHLAEAYIESESHDREGRVRDMLARVGISVVSGAISTLGASMFLFFPTIIFFNKFGIMIFMTIGFSLFWALVFFPALMSTPLGPEGNMGNWLYVAKKLYYKFKARNTHELPPAGEI
eukprot:TRINITY_DN13_c0_g1_i9.p1 TRINITY_DN13_c0_g1~~TRINITY_DN13_c0_g1_i9.p1  ORF type:complete len:1041 (+),score=286.38 TRINITY_DN13_c0_g1_i9:142-3264(+)